MMNQVINFFLKLIVILGVVFAIHLIILAKINQPLFNNFIIEAYIVNGLLAIIIYSILNFLKKKYLDMLGFIFMFGSFLKFGVYFIFFYPVFKEDGVIIRQEATSFLVPYIASLIVETYCLVKLLNEDG
jgi:hypothetical protein